MGSEPADSVRSSLIPHSTNNPALKLGLLCGPEQGGGGGLHGLPVEPARFIGLPMKGPRIEHPGYISRPWDAQIRHTCAPDALEHRWCLGGNRVLEVGRFSSSWPGGAL